MQSRSLVRAAVAAAALLALAAPLESRAQTRFVSASDPAPAGAHPTAIAIDPVTRKLYVANHDDGTVTVMHTRYPAAQAIATVPVGRQPNHVAINTETDAVYVSNEGDGTMSVIDARTNQVRATGTVQVGGAMAVNPFTGHMFMLRESPSDEFNIIVGDAFLQASATRAYQPVTLAMNPVTNRLFVGTEATTDVVPFDMTGDAVYPTRECPDGHGGLIPDPGQSNPNPPACIDVPGFPVSVAVNPVTNRAYALTSAGQIAVIQGPAMTWNVITLAPEFAGTNPQAIAVDPVANEYYVLYGNRLVHMNGATDTAIAVRDLPGPGVALALDVNRGIAFVATSSGQMLWLATRLSGVNSGTVAIPADARGIVFDPVTLRPYVLCAAGVTTVTVSGDFPLRSTQPLTLNIRTLPQDRTFTTSGSIVIDAASNMTPAPLDQVRAVYYRLIGPGDANDNSKPFARATRNGDGTWSAAYSGLSFGGNYILDAYATNGLDVDSINTDKARGLVQSLDVQYNFTVSGPETRITGPLVKAFKRRDFNGDLKGDLAWRNANGQSGAWLMNGLSIAQAGNIAGPAGAAIVQLADFDGDGKTDALWRGADNSYTVTLLDGFTVRSTTSLLGGGTPWTPIATGDFNGDGKADLLWSNGTGGYGVWYMNGSSVASASGFSAGPAGENIPVGIGDFDGGGRDELLWMATANGAITIMRLANGSLETVAPLRGSDTSVPIAIADFNGDGKADVVAQYPDGTTELWLVDGTRSTGASRIGFATLISAGTGWTVAFAPDHDGDGKADLVWRGADGGVAGWLMNGTSPRAFRSWLAGGTCWSPAGIGDLDADGKTDLLWRCTDGMYAAWKMNGLDVSATATIDLRNSGWDLLP